MQHTHRRQNVYSGGGGARGGSGSIGERGSAISCVCAPLIRAKSTNECHEGRRPVVHVALGRGIQSILKAAPSLHSRARRQGAARDKSWGGAQHACPRLWLRRQQGVYRRSMGRQRSHWKTGVCWERWRRCCDDFRHAWQRPGTTIFWPCGHASCMSYRILRM